MARFLGICHENCDLRYVGEVLEFRKLDFRGLIVQFDVKMDNFRGLIAKIGHLRSFEAKIGFKNRLLEPTNCPFSWIMSCELCPKVCWRGSRVQKVRFWGSQRPIGCQNYQF